ncbi:hypothetical protein RMR21_015615 [Agrobacterium sp. rho-8.1]|nr:hypothetical protein [Agrobacterium sp. rho-8.1]
MQINLARAGIALGASEPYRPVVTLSAIDARKITGKSLGFSLAMLAASYDNHAFLSGISKALIWHD